MINNLQFEEFLKKNRISKETWDSARIEWSLLQSIAADHEAQTERLGNTASSFANEIQKFDKVHSVRWRVKEPEHLLEKIVRKRAEKNEKYETISLENYYQCVTDLVGIRALHLFKGDCFEIDDALKNSWDQIENPVAYVRNGDSDELNVLFKEKGFEVKIHPAGYRSVHYVFESYPNKRKLVTEVQVRTIFEEGWSEIDHKVRYPNFSENELVGYFLTIFNRLAGNADEMGGFVLGLVENISQLEKQAAEAVEEKKITLRDMEQALSQLENVEKQNQASKDIIAKLKGEVAKLKETKNIGLPTASTSHGLLGSTNVFDLSSHGMLGATTLSDIANRNMIGTTTVADMVRRGMLGTFATADVVNRVFSGTNSLADLANRGMLGTTITADIEKRGLMGTATVGDLAKRGILSKKTKD